MPSMLRITAAVAVAALLAGCRPDAGARAGDRPPSSPARGAAASASPSPRYTGPLDPQPTGPDDGIDPTGVVSPTVTGSVPGACGLVHEADLVTVVAGETAMGFPHDPVETNTMNVMTGATSHCHWEFDTHWTNEFGLNVGTGLLDVQVQSAGAEGFVPPQPGVGTVVDGIGDGAVQRNGKLYVRLGDGLLTVELALPTGSKDWPAHSVVWGQQLARIVVGRLRGR